MLISPEPIPLKSFSRFSGSFEPIFELKKEMKKPKMFKLLKPLQRVSDVISSIAKEFFSVLLTLGAVTYGLFAKNKDPSPIGNQPLLLIHGYGMNSGHFVYLKYFLKKKGLGPIYTIDLKGLKSIDDYVRQVEAKVKQIQQVNSNKITLVGHSMGGIVATRYLANCNDTKHLKQVITLGSPLQGTYTAYMALGKCAKEMRPHSPYLKQLEKDLAHTDFPIVTVKSQCDLIVLPNQHGCFHDVQAETQTFNNVGHNHYLFSPLIGQFISKKLHK